MGAWTRGGADLLDGGNGFDFLTGDAENLAGDACGGNDRLIGGADGVVMAGDASEIRGRARGGDDWLSSGDGVDTIYGDGSLFASARGGNDRIEGGAGGDFLVGDGFAMGDTACGGSDRIDGGAGNDRIYGDGFRVYGRVRAGNDTITGGAGDDSLFGDARSTAGDLTRVTRGCDRFVFATGSGQDTIFDFETQRDVIDLNGYAAITSVPNLLTFASQSGANVVIDLGEAAGGAADVDTLTLSNILLADISAANFDLV